MPEPTHYSLQQALASFAIQSQSIASTRLTNDSRAMQPGDVFCAVIGEQQDGRDYINQAIAAGASCVLAQCEETSQHGVISHQIHAGQPITIVQFFQLNLHMFALAKAFYRAPQNKMNMIGITGTNGKTSTSLLIAQLFERCEQSCAVIGTVGAGRLHALRRINNTTPGANELHQLLSEFARDKVCHVAMEVSSHALVQQRVSAELLDIAVFTNLSRDHLDYHHTMENYAAAKQQIFSADAQQSAVINGDDAIACQWLKQWPESQSVVVYGRGQGISGYEHYVQGTDIEHHRSGISFLLRTHQGNLPINSPLMGDFNLDNLLAAIAVLMLSGCSLHDIGTAVQGIQPIIGRMEASRAKHCATAVVDYAHTPDALENALRACRLHCQGQLWVVFGCGGDRDKGKRGLMGQTAEQNADHVIITNDNPRGEQPLSIAQDILTGCAQPDKIQQILDRKQAVLSALNSAKATDFVLLAGKGHEDHIIIGSQKIDYNERELVADFYNNKNKAIS
jgi:UDP-N-acetylmuramoyl-L-alanyl-D-glutamate--2,6-diaminopimelate ligase